MKPTVVVKSVSNEALEQSKHFKTKKKHKEKILKIQKEKNMFRPNLIKRVKLPADAIKEPVKQTNSTIWIKEASEDVCCGENMQEYLKSTSLHGMKYIANRNITLFER